MTAERINRVSTAALVILSLTALLPILIAVAGVIASGQLPLPETDEGTGAHIFQLSIAMLVPVGLVFLASADWTRPARIVRSSALPAVAVLLAFALLYYFEHYLHRV